MAAGLAVGRAEAVAASTMAEAVAMAGQAEEAAE